MTTPARLAFLFGSLFSIVGATSPALADENPCGPFDFSAGIDCRIEVSGGCSLQCDPIHFEVACSGGCDATATTTCSDSCEGMCNSQCNPETIDCMAGCDSECESRCNNTCTLEDCTDECSASCHSNCQASCTGQATDCQSACKECCHGACTTEVNIDCDVACYADLEASCSAQCDAPAGALFCNGQYVGASDVNACIQWLATQGLDVNVEARAKATCGLSGCEGTSDVLSGCSMRPSEGSSDAPYGFAIALGGAAAMIARRRRNKR